MSFSTDYRYSDRRTKARYVWQKYSSILRGSSILDVGADECHLKEHLDETSTYWGIGLGGNPDQQCDLDSGSLPFHDASYDCVICLDVLEHLNSIHAAFDDLCRVSRRWVIVSLPNAWSCFWRVLRKGHERSGASMKFYGLPTEKPEDRHCWFFSETEARRFITHRAEKSHMHLVQLDSESDGVSASRWTARLRRWKQTLFLSRQIDRRDLYAGTVWALLEKRPPRGGNGARGTGG